MLLCDDIHQLFKNKTDHISFLKKYAGIANTLMYQSEGFIKEVVKYLSDEITIHSQKSQIYHGKKIITKKELLDKDKWYLPYNSFENETSGSTGKPFKYKIWHDIYDKIECESHYKTISEEFSINGPAKILYLQHDIIKPNSSELISTYVTQNPLISHGLRRQAEIHSVIINKTFYNNYYKYYEELIDYIINNNIDIIHTQSNTIASLAWNIKRLRRKEKLCRLLSNTGSKLNRTDTTWLQQNGNIEAWCDHMRCWDGGATFFTCTNNTYHLLDGLAWSYSEDYKLISTDYFSLPSPFVNYWNGDYADISDAYERCKCGRAFRRFEMGRARSKITQVSEVSEIQSTLTDNNLLDGLKRVEVIQKFIRIFTKYSLPHDQKQSIKNIFPGTHLQFTVEEDI